MENVLSSIGNTIQSESDDDESFVVLGHSLPPESMSQICECDRAESFDTNVIQESLTLVNSALSQLALSGSSLPSMPKVNRPETKAAEEDGLSNTFHLSVDLSPDEIQQRVDSLVKENIKLKETLHQNNLAMKSQYDVLISWQEDVHKVHLSHKQKFAEMKQFIENLKLENAKLNKLVKLSQNVQHNQDCDFRQSMSQEMSDNKEKRSELLNKIQELQKEVAQQKQLNIQVTNDYKSELQQSESVQKVLLAKIKVLREASECAVPKEEHKNVQEQLVAAQMHITNLELSRNQDREIINAKEEMINKLQKELKDVDELNNTILALIAQVDIYKSDFEAERQAKECIKSEKDRIAEDLQHLIRTNQRLLEEKESLVNGGFVYVGRPEQPPTPASAPQDSPPLGTHDCPLCRNRFQSLQMLQDHIEYCIK